MQNIDVYKAKSEEFSDFQYGVLATTKTTLNKFYSKTNSSNNNNNNNSQQQYYLNSKRIMQQQQQDNNLLTKTNQVTSAITSEPNNVYLSNNTNATTILTTAINPLEIPTQPTLIPIRSSIQPLNRLVGIKKRKRRFKKPIELRKVLPKNSLMLLHELMPNVEYRFVKQNGPIHKPIFTMSVDIDPHTFEGVGKTKKEARMLAADKALKFLMEFPEFIQKNKVNKESEANCADSKANENLDDENSDENDGLINDNDDLNEININIVNNENKCTVLQSEFNLNITAEASLPTVDIEQNS